MMSEQLSHPCRFHVHQANCAQFVNDYGINTLTLLPLTTASCDNTNKTHRACYGSRQRVPSSLFPLLLTILTRRSQFFHLTEHCMCLVVFIVKLFITSKQILDTLCWRSDWTRHTQIDRPITSILTSRPHSLSKNTSTEINIYAHASMCIYAEDTLSGNAVTLWNI